MSKLLDNTLAADTLAENGAWVRACGVAHLQRGELESYAKQKGRTRQAISRWVAAWQMYWWLRDAWHRDPNLRVYPHPLEMREMTVRQYLAEHKPEYLEESTPAYKLTQEHFVELGEWQRRHEVEPFEVYVQLFTAWRDGVDAKAMRVQLDGIADGGRGIPEWYRRASGVMADLGKLRTDYGAPDEVKTLASMTYEALKEWMEYGVATGG